MTSGELLAQFRGLRALVVGDLMLDEYLVGRATRISPEAPVMVVRQEKRSLVPGGAANVARNLAALGARVGLVGVVGEDDAGASLRAALEESGIADACLVTDVSRPTTRKTRVMADHAHQVIRVDVESETPVSEKIERDVLLAAMKRLADWDVIVLSDYLKGTTTATVVGTMVKGARELGKPLVANPKPRSLSHYHGVSLVSLNRAEAAEAYGDGPLADADAPEVAAKLAESIGADAALVTLGEAGLVVGRPGSEPISVSARRVAVYDTAGAGDTVIACVALGLAAAGVVPEVFRLAADAAACVVRKVGVAAPSEEDLAEIASGYAGANP